MGIRNSKELGSNLTKIANKLLTNQDLLKLLVNIDKNPLAGAPIENPSSLLHKNICVIPRINEEEFSLESKIALIFGSANVIPANKEFKDLVLNILVYVPLDSWIINSEDLRPFLIMSKIEESIKGKRLDGIGLLELIGFNLELVTDKVSCYKMSFGLDVFN